MLLLPYEARLDIQAPDGRHDTAAEGEGGHLGGYRAQRHFIHWHFRGHALDVALSDVVGVDLALKEPEDGIRHRKSSDEGHLGRKLVLEEVGGKRGRVTCVEDPRAKLSCLLPSSQKTAAFCTPLQKAEEDASARPHIHTHTGTSEEARLRVDVIIQSLLSASDDANLLQVLAHPRHHLPPLPLLIVFLPLRFLT